MKNAEDGDGERDDSRMVSRHVCWLLCGTLGVRLDWASLNFPAPRRLLMRSVSPGVPSMSAGSDWRGAVGRCAARFVRQQIQHVADPAADRRLLRRLLAPAPSFCVALEAPTSVTCSLALWPPSTRIT